MSAVARITGIAIICRDVLSLFILFLIVNGRQFAIEMKTRIIFQDYCIVCCLSSDICRARVWSRHMLLYCAELYRWADWGLIDVWRWNYIGTWTPVQWAWYSYHRVIMTLLQLLFQELPVPGQRCRWRAVAAPHCHVPYSPTITTSLLPVWRQRILIHIFCPMGFV